MLCVPDAEFSNRMQYSQPGCWFIDLLQAEGNILLVCSKTSIRFVCVCVCSVGVTVDVTAEVLWGHE